MDTRTIVAMTIILLLIWGGFFVFIRVAMDREKAKHKVPKLAGKAEPQEPNET